MNRVGPQSFFSLCDQRPPVGVVVRVIWNGRGPFLAARVAHPQTRAACWITHDHGEAIFLPCRQRAPDATRPWVGWHTLKGDGPEYWSPQKPAAWKFSKLPAPALEYPENAPPIMWSARQSFDAVAAAEEMEADRAAAQAQPQNAKRGEKRKLWWLDATLVRYSPPGAISRQEAEGRMMRALASDTLDDAIMGLGLHSGANPLRDMDIEDIRALAEIEADEIPAIHERFESGGLDRADYDIAMGWFAALGARELYPSEAASSSGWRLFKRLRISRPQLALFFASRDKGMSFSEIARAIRIVERGTKLSRRRASDIYREAIEAVWTIANEFQDTGRANRAAALAQVQDGNRRARGTR